MSIDLGRLLEEAFYDEELQNASEAIERALERFETIMHGGARPFEVVAPAELDEQWLRERLIRPLVYFCESEGTPLPRCGNIMIALFVNTRLYAIAAERVIQWASDALTTSVEQLRQTYGTQNVDQPVQ